MSCHCEDKILDFDFQGFTTILSMKGERIHIKITNGNRNIFDSFFPRIDHLIDLEISHIPHILLNNSNVITTISFLKNGNKKSEIGINYLTKRISLVKDFKDKIDKIIDLPERKEDTKLVYFCINQDQELSIPNDAKEVIIECWGAGGGTPGYSNGTTSYNTGYGGGGGYVKTSMLDVAGKKFNVIVGQGGQTFHYGQTSSGSYGGGGYSQGNGWGSSSAGGRTALQMQINGIYEDIVTAGGGGAAGMNEYSGELYGLGAGAPGGGSEADNAPYYEGFPIYSGYGGTIYDGGQPGYTVTGIVGAGGEYYGGVGAYGGGGGSGFNGGGSGGAITFDVEGLNFNKTMPTKGALKYPTIWLDASDENSIKTSNGVVTSWEDKSQNKLNFTKYYGNSILYSKDEFLGKPCLFFNESSLSSDLAAGTFSNGITAFIVMSSLGTATYNNPGLCRTLGSDKKIADPFDIYNNSRFCGSLNDGSSVTTSTNDLSSQLDPCIFTFQLSATQAYNEWINGENKFTNSTIISSYEDKSTTIQIGGRSDNFTFLNGSIAEIIVYDSYLDQNSIKEMNLYLSNKWNINMNSIKLVTPGNYWLFGGGGGGCSFVNSTYARQIESLKGNKRIAAAYDKIPSEYRGRIGNGGVATCQTGDGKAGFPGLMIVTIKR